MSVPDWYETALLGVLAWRIFQLLAKDTILDRPRRYVLRLGNEWSEQGDPVPDNYRVRLADFLTCPYCLGAWLSLGVYAAWLVVPPETLALGAIAAISALIVAGSELLGSE